MNNVRAIKSNPQISEEAAEWFIEFRSGDVDPEGRRAFDAWLRASPEHLRAFIEMSALWHESGSIDPERKFSIEDIIARASAESTVIDFDAGTASRDSETSHVSVGYANTKTARADGAGWMSAGQGAERQRTATVVSGESGRRAPNRLRRVALLATAATVVGLMVIVFVVRGQFHRQPVYATEVGEQRSFRLADGSTVILDSRSRLRLDFDDSVRAVDLLQGRALFRVAANPGRPFIVHAGGTTVRVMGTQFDVNENARATVVTVVEGRVAVYSGGGVGGIGNGRGQLDTHQDEITQGDSTRGNTTQRDSTRGDSTQRDSTQGDSTQDDFTLLSAGEQLSVTAGEGSAQPVHANVSSVTAWTQGRLILESASLTEVADEFNRYSSRKLVAEDHGLAPLKLSGVFATDPDFLIQYLRNRPDIVVRETNTEVHIVRKARE
jgi:transmembrane sensor